MRMSTPPRVVDRRRLHQHLPRRPRAGQRDLGLLRRLAASSGVEFSVFQAGVIALTLLYSAFIAEIYRVGAGGDPDGPARGRAGARDAPDPRVRLGDRCRRRPRSRSRTSASMFIGMVKDTSTFTVIGLLEVVRVTQNVNSTYFQPFVLYTARGGALRRRRVRDRLHLPGDREAHGEPAQGPCRPDGDPAQAPPHRGRRSSRVGVATSGRPERRARGCSERGPRVVLAASRRTAALAVAGCGGDDDDSGVGRGSRRARSPDGVGDGFKPLNSGQLTVGMNLQFKPEMYLDERRARGLRRRPAQRARARARRQAQHPEPRLQRPDPGPAVQEVRHGLGRPDADRRAQAGRRLHARLRAVRARARRRRQGRGEHHRPSTRSTPRARRSPRCRAPRGEQLAKKLFPDAKVQGFPDQNAAFLEVATGRADGIVVEDYLLAQFQASNAGKLDKAAIDEAARRPVRLVGRAEGQRGLRQVPRHVALQGAERRHAREHLQEGLRRRRVPADAGLLMAGWRRMTC